MLHPTFYGPISDTHRFILGVVEAPFYPGGYESPINYAHIKISNVDQVVHDQHVLHPKGDRG